MFYSHKVINTKEITGKQTNMICLVCEEGHLYETYFYTEIEYKGERATIEDQMNVCDICGCCSYISGKKSNTATQIKEFKMSVDEKEK